MSADLSVGLPPWPSYPLLSRGSSVPCVTPGISALNTSAVSRQGERSLLGVVSDWLGRGARTTKDLSIDIHDVLFPLQGAVSALLSHVPRSGLGLVGQ